MVLPILKINYNNLKNNGGTLGHDYIVGSLKNSGVFEIQDHTDEIKCSKGFRGTILYFNNKKIYLDFWEYSAPTHNDAILDANFDLIIKLQHLNMSFPYYMHYCKRKNMFQSYTEDQMREFFNKIVPWTFFPSKSHIPYIGRENELPSLPTEQLGFFCGRNWKARHEIKKKLDKEGILFIENQIPGHRISDEKFMHYMASSKYGFVLPGRSTGISDAKNRREIDYMMMRKPLLISYKPFYYDPLIVGKHFIYFDQKTDFKTLHEVYNIEEMVENAFQWYQRNVIPSGIVSSFLKIMSDRGLV